ncbi:MAG: DUF2934 domain-containing protein [Bryobacteraceae bacterium]|nr:DUF2934 domain-containing protein [Bryobacteraceae bacterium]
MPAKKPAKKLESTETAATPAAEIAIKPTRKRAAAPKSPAATHKQDAPRAAARTRKPAAPKPVFDPSLHHDEIAREAYYLWQVRGCAHGHEAEDWFRAVEMVRARYE